MKPTMSSFIWYNLCEVHVYQVKAIYQYIPLPQSENRPFFEWGHVVKGPIKPFWPNIVNIEFYLRKHSRDATNHQIFALRRVLWTHPWLPYYMFTVRRTKFCEFQIVMFISILFCLHRKTDIKYHHDVP